VLDVTAKQIQNAKKQQEWIYNDNIYFISSKPSENALEWVYKKDKVMFETDNDTEINEYEVVNKYNML